MDSSADRISLIGTGPVFPDVVLEALGEPVGLVEDLLDRAEHACSGNVGRADIAWTSEGSFSRHSTTPALNMLASQTRSS